MHQGAQQRWSCCRTLLGRYIEPEHVVSDNTLVLGSLMISLPSICCMIRYKAFPMT